MAKSNDLAELEAQAAFQRKTLEESRKRLANEPLVIEYDNGGGQTGIRENPEWLAYEKLLKSYQATLRAIAAQTVKPKAKETGIGSPLLNFRNEYKAVTKSA